jgi:hypothetical protein
MMRYVGNMVAAAVGAVVAVVVVLLLRERSSLRMVSRHFRVIFELPLRL